MTTSDLLDKGISFTISLAEIKDDVCQKYGIDPSSVTCRWRLGTVGDCYDQNISTICTGVDVIVEKEATPN